MRHICLHIKCHICSAYFSIYETYMPVPYGPDLNATYSVGFQVQSECENSLKLLDGAR